LQIGGIPFVGDATDLRYCDIPVWTLDWQPTTIPPPNPLKEVHELGQKLKAEQDQKLGGVKFFGTGVFSGMRLYIPPGKMTQLPCIGLSYPLAKATFFWGLRHLFSRWYMFFFCFFLA